MKALRMLGIGAGIVIVAFALAVAGVLWLAGSERGTAYLAARAAPLVAGTVRIGGVGGTLLDGVTLRDVEIAAGADRVSIAVLELAWNPWALTARTLELGEVHATDVRHRREAAAPPAGGAFELPLTVVVGRGRIDRLVLEAAPDWPVEAVRFHGRFAGSRLALEGLAAEARGFTIGGRAALALAPRLELETALDWRGEIEARDAAGQLAVEGAWPLLRFTHVLTAPFPADARGTVDFADEPVLDAAIEWRDLAVPGVEWAASPSGRVEIEGGLDGVRFAGSGAAILDDHEIDFAASGAADRERVLLDSLSLSSALGQATAAGTFLLESRRFEASLEAENVDFAALAPEWPSRLAVRGRTEGTLSPALEWRFAASDLEGELRGYPLAGEGTVAGASGVLELAGVRLFSGDNRVAVDGRVGEALDLALSADLRELEVAWPGLGGQLAAELRIGGTRAAPAVEGSAAAEALEYAGWSVARLEAAADLGAAGEGSVRLEAEGVGRGAFAVERLQADVTGSLGAHAIRLAADAEEWDAVAAATGGLEGGRWRGSVERLDVEQPALGPWRLAAPAPLRLRAGGVGLDTSCLAQNRTRLCAELRLEGEPEDSLVVSAQNFELGALRPFLPPGMTLDGVYQLSASFTGLARAPRGSMSVVGGTTRATAALSAEEEPLALTLEDLVLTAELTDWQLAVASRVNAEQGAVIDLRARMDDVRRTDSPIAGTLAASLPDLGFAAVFSPDVERVGGRASVELEIGGTAAEPAVDGRAELASGEISVPEWGLLVTGIEAQAVSADGRELRFAATGEVDDREVAISGRTELDPQAGWPTELTLTGEAVHAVARPDVDIFVTPDLRAVVRLPDIAVSGTVHVPRARVEVGQLPEQAVAPSADAVVHGVAVPRPARPLRMQSDIVITLGEDVKYRALSLDADVSGEMRLRRAADGAATASGSLRLDGAYNAYGQSLTLDRGQLLFTGPLDDPALDVRAVRRIEATTVGVELAGTVKAPRTRIYSDPPMSEADALSYLLFGRPLTGTGSEETATLQTAALAMGLQQALPVVQRIGQSLGLDEFAVQTTAADAGSLMAGKYLSPKVYIRYSYGLVNRIGGLLLRFRVNERLSIETRSGEQKSMDLLYTVEKE